MNTPSRPLLALLASVSLAACGSESTTTADVPDASVDAALEVTPGDNPPADATEAGPPRCEVPPVRLGDSSAAGEFLSRPARCGQDTFRMNYDARLGVPNGTGARQNFSAALLQGLAAGSGIMLPVALQYDVAVEQVSYTTQDRGRTLDATTLVAYPRNLTAARAFEVLLVLHGTAGFNDACAPSGSTEARGLAAAFASAGYVVVAPDYIGLRAFGGSTGFPHPYLVGSTTAVASLDAVRAGIRHIAAQGTETCARPRFVTIGGSQGGHAALWVDRIAAYYAPELELMGTVATVPPADLEGQTNRGLRMTVQASANIMAFYTVVAPWYGLGGRLSEVFRAPWVESLPRALASSCSPGDMLRDATRETVFTPALLAAGASMEGVRSLNPWGCLVTENGVTTTSVPRAPNTHPGNGILWVLGEQDQLVDTPTERRSFETLCRAGYRMQYLECAGAAHTRATTWALPEILEFARARLDERPLDAAQSCRITPPVRCRATPAM